MLREKETFLSKSDKSEGQQWSLSGLQSWAGSLVSIVEDQNSPVSESVTERGWRGVGRGDVWQRSACWGSVTGTINFPSTVSTNLDELWSQFLEYTALVSGELRPRLQQQTPKENLQPSLSLHILGQTPRCGCQTQLNTNQLIFTGTRRAEHEPTHIHKEKKKKCCDAERGC